MAKTKKISLRRIVRGIERAEEEISKARKTATPKGKRELALAIKNLRSVRKEAIARCKTVYTLHVVERN